MLGVQAMPAIRSTGTLMMRTHLPGCTSTQYAPSWMLVSAVRTLPGTTPRYSAMHSTLRIEQGCLGSAMSAHPLVGGYATARIVLECRAARLYLNLVCRSSLPHLPFVLRVGLLPFPIGRPQLAEQLCLLIFQRSRHSSGRVALAGELFTFGGQHGHLCGERLYRLSSTGANWINHVFPFAGSPFGATAGMYSPRGPGKTPGSICAPYTLRDEPLRLPDLFLGWRPDVCPEVTGAQPEECIWRTET